MKMCCQYSNRTWISGLTVRQMFPNNDRDHLIFGKRVFSTRNRAARMASLLCEGKLTQEENKGTSHVPVVHTCAETQPHTETPQSNEHRCHVSNSPFWDFLGETRGLKMFKGVFWFKDERKQKSFEISSEAGVFILWLLVSCVHGCWSLRTNAHTMLNHSVLNSYLNIHFTMPLLRLLFLKLL